MILSASLAFFAAYFTVLLLGLNSKILRDDRVLAAFCVSWGITLAQTAATYVIAHSLLPLPWYIFIAGWGGSLGIVSSHYVYTHLTQERA